MSQHHSTVIKIEYDSQQMSSVLDLTNLIRDIIPEADEHVENIRIEITHRVRTREPSIILICNSLYLRSRIQIDVVIKPDNSSYKKRDLANLTETSPIFINRLDPRVRLTLTGYRLQIETGSRINTPLLVDRAYAVTDSEIIVIPQGCAKIEQELNAQDRSDIYQLTTNRIAYDMIGSRRSLIRSLERSTKAIRTDKTPNSIKLTCPSIIVGRVEAIDHVRVRIDSDVEILSSIHGGILCSVADTIHFSELIVNGNMIFTNARACGILAGYTRNLSDSSLKIRGTVLLSSNTGCNVIGLMVGILKEISGEIKVDIRERVVIDNRARQIGIVAGMLERDNKSPYRVYAEPISMIYNITYLENTYQRSVIEGAGCTYGDIGLFSNKDVDRALNSMVDFDTESQLRDSPEIDRVNDTELIIEKNDDPIIQDIIESKIELSYGPNRSVGKSIDTRGGIFRAAQHIQTHGRDHEKSNSAFGNNSLSGSFDDHETYEHEINDIIESTRRAIREKRTTIKSKAKSRSKSDSRDNNRSDKIFRLSRKPDNHTRKRVDTRKAIRSIESLKIDMKDSGHLRSNTINSRNDRQSHGPGLYDRRSDARVEPHRFVEPKPVEEQEEKIFRHIRNQNRTTVGSKQTIDDRRKSTNYEARQARANRLKKNIRAF